MGAKADIRGRMTENELAICQFGEEACRPLHAFGPAQRDHYLIHFVVSGSGTFFSGGVGQPVRAGQGFLILPGEETFYQADAREPWHYAWVGYRGRQAEALTREAGLDETHRVFTAQDASGAWETLRQMRQDARMLRLGQLAATGSLLRFLALIAPAQSPDMDSSRSRTLCDKALWYLEGRFDRPVSIQEAADFAGVSRSHLYRLMMAEYGCSPKAMLQRIRMEQAVRLLTGTTLTLEEIAPRVGLQNGAQLGAAFRRAFGVAPGAYRRRKKAD
ncbi:MAG: AraC family ligand binding domain-containing protein [Aristaeellaceae bacterium]